VLIPFSLLLIKYFPQLGRGYGRWSGGEMWLGVTMQKNGLGRLCLIAAFFLVWTLVRRWQGRDKPVSKYHTHVELFLLLLTLWLMKGPPGCYPATAVAALVLGLAAFFGLLWMHQRQFSLAANTWVMVIVFVIAFGSVTPFVGGATVGGFSSVLGRDETLTGRTEIWASLLPVVDRHPLLGAGVGGFWTSETRARYASEAHSGYLDVLLDLGFLGILLVAAFVISCCRKFHDALARDYDWASLCLCVLLMALLHNISESSIVSLTSHLTAIVLFLAVSVGPATQCDWQQELNPPFLR